MFKFIYSQINPIKIIEILNKQRILRRLILVFIDTISIIICTFFLYWNTQSFTLDKFLSLSIVLILFGIPLYLCTGQYKGLTKYLNSIEVYKIFLRNSLLSCLIFFISFLGIINIPSINFTFQFLFIISGISSLTKLLMRDILLNFSKSQKAKSKIKKIAIFGANSYGAQLERILKRENSYRVINFFDYNSQLIGRNLNGLPILSINQIEKIKNSIEQVFICIPTINRSHLREVFDIFRSHNLPVLQVPSIDDLTSKSQNISNLKQIEIEDIIGRDIVKPNKEILSKAIMNSVVLVTGAGGSIGAELCKQIIELRPKKLIILDSSEPNLYQIEREIKEISFKETDIQTILGSACNKNHMERIFESNKIDSVFHAAAYKHVPLVEKNPLTGIHNNIISTRVICSLVMQFNIKKFVLISTDKAVRPTNVMGASKRLSELIVQAFSELSQHKKEETRTCFCMVRFGNVLGSSGSVVPLFKEQISKGGPITITNEKVVRYFMTITEASQLVLQASVIAEGGDVFLLDMGEPTLVKDLAKRMIHASGLSVRNENNPKGDIEIKYIGLRPGEKLFEELLINAESKKTNHPLIFRAVEESIPQSQIFPELDKLEKYLKDHDKENTLNLLNYLVPEWIREN